MNKQIKQAWVNALKSGEYKQGTGVLNYEGEFCCLGVLCDIYSKETGEAWSHQNNIKSLAMHKVDNFLPMEVVEWAEFNSNQVSNQVEDSLLVPRGEFSVYFTSENESYGSEVTVLAELNDSGASFKQIADLIEKYL